MKIVMFGATGTLGSRILGELTARGHEVTAVIRNPAHAPAGENVTVTAGDIFDSGAVADAARGADVVVSAYGPGPAKPGSLPDAMKSLVAGVEAAGVKRLLTVGGAGGLQVKPGMRLIDTPDFPAEWKAIAQAHIDALDVLRRSNLDWTSVSPAAYTHPGKRTGRYRTDTERLIVSDGGQSEISAEDFAIAVADEAENAGHPRQRFTAA
jgi:putative NADH-flavin reductase